MMTKDASRKKAGLLLTWLKNSKNLNLEPDEIAKLFARRFDFLPSISLRSRSAEGVTAQRMTVKIGTQIYEYKRVFQKTYGQVKSVIDWNTKANWPA